MTAMPLALPGSVRMAALPRAVREEIDLFTRVFERTRVTKPRMMAYEAAAHELRTHGHKISASGVRALMAEYLSSDRDPMTFKDHRKVPHDDNKLPVLFVEEVKRRFTASKRGISTAYDALIDEWRAGVPLPGYPVSPVAYAYTDVPYGWSESNLRKVAKTSAFEKAAMRIGLGHAKARHGVKHRKTRVGLWPMSHVMPDDVVHDNFVHLHTNRQLCRAADLGFLDVLSGSRFFWGTKPLDRRVDPKTGREVMNGWREESMRFGTCAVLYQFGFSPRGTTWVTELGTAALREKVARIMYDRTKALYGEPLLFVDAAPITGRQQAVAGIFQGKGGGNPRHKSCLESLHNLIHNRLGLLPGQTGPDVERRPEELHGLLNDAAALLGIMDTLTPWQQERLKFPTLEYYSEFLPILDAIYRKIDERTNHNLEGWEECGFLTRDFRLHNQSQEWISEDKFLQMPATAQHAVREIVRCDETCQRPRRLSPRTVFQSGLKELIKPPIGLMAEILYDDLATPRKVDQGIFSFEDQDIAPGELRYESRIRTEDDGREHELPDGEKYETVVNPFQPEMLWVYSRRGDGAFLGIARRDVAPRRGDRQGEGRKLARIRERFDDQLAPLQARHADIAREERLRLAHNTDVITGPASPEEAALRDYMAKRPTRAALPDDDIPDETPIPESTDADHPQFGRFLHPHPNPEA